MIVFDSHILGTGRGEGWSRDMASRTSECSTTVSRFDYSSSSCESNIDPSWSRQVVYLLVRPVHLQAAWVSLFGTQTWMELTFLDDGVVVRGGIYLCCPGNSGRYSIFQVRSRTVTPGEVHSKRIRTCGQASLHSFYLPICAQLLFYKQGTFHSLNRKAGTNRC
jgi:hypothetical protein